MAKKVLNGNEHGKGFDKNPENINRNGRPRKTINSVNKELEDQGIKPTTANEIKDIYLRLVNMEMAELKILVEDLKQPALIRIVGKKILSEKGFDIIEKMLDRSLGKPNQSIDLGIADKDRESFKSLFPTQDEIDAAG